jgi:hypothetical protein
MGAVLVLVGALVFATAILVGVVGLPLLVLTIMVVAALVGVIATGFLLTRIAVLVRLDDLGYQVRYLRGAGVLRARWSDVDDVVTGFASGQAVVVIRLTDGRTTTIPVNLIAGDSDDFARDIADHARRGHGRR